MGQDPNDLLEWLEVWTNKAPSDIQLDDSIRRRLRDASRNFSIAMETPGDTVHRISSLVISAFVIGPLQSRNPEKAMSNTTDSMGIRI